MPKSSESTVQWKPRMTLTAKKLWKNEYFRTAVAIVVIVIVVFGFWFGAQTLLGTPYPALAVASGSMYLPRGAKCDGWSHPFAPTLQTGDLIIIEGVKPDDIYANPGNGDILVFTYTDPVTGESTLIVHRAVGKIVGQDGTLEFITWGDNNYGPGPGSPTPAADVIGKVVLRIPWFGWLALLMRDSSAVYVIAVIIVLLIIVELALPERTSSKTETELKEVNPD
jgi:signal peptidase I